MSFLFCTICIKLVLINPFVRLFFLSGGYDMYSFSAATVALAQLSTPMHCISLGTLAVDVVAAVLVCVLPSFSFSLLLVSNSMLTVEEDKFDCFGVSVEETNVELSVMGVSDEEVSTCIF